MNNIWFYTFSTSAQVLAALVGLFSIFAVYRIQKYSDDIEDVKGGIFELLERCSGNMNYGFKEELKKEELYFLSNEEIQKKFESLIKTHNGVDPNKRAPVDTTFSHNIYGFCYELSPKTLKIYKDLIDKKSIVLRYLMGVLLSSFFAIGFMVFCLSFPQTNEYMDNIIKFNLIIIAFNLGLIGVMTYNISRV